MSPFRLTSVIGQFFDPRGSEGLRQRDRMGGIVILASFEYHSIKERENLELHPSNY